MLESKKDHVKIAKLLRFESTRSDFTSLEEVCRPLIPDKTELITSTLRIAKKARSRSTTSLALVKRLLRSLVRRSSKSSKREGTRCCC